MKQLQKENYKVVRNYMETYREDLEDDIVESQQYRIRALLVPKLGNHAKSSDIAVEFINVNKLSEDEIKNYEQGIAFIEGIENPYKLKPSKVMSLVQDKLSFFNMPLHTKCWKFFEARPREDKVGFKGEYSSFVEGFDGYLYTKQWVSFLVTELQKPEVLEKVEKAN